MNENPIRRALEITELTQEDLAKRLGISRQTLINYENNPDTIPAGTLVNISDLTSLSVGELMTYKKKKTPSPKLPPLYEKESLKSQKYIDKLNVILSDSGLNLEDDKYYRDEIKSILQNIRDNAVFRQRKPIIAAFGKPDTGKSTLFNHIIGETVAPASFQPLTSALTYFRHISEKPADMGRLDNARVEFKEHGEEKTEDNNHQYILKECGIRGGKFCEKEGIEVTRIDVFLDKDILKEFTYLDVPGFGSERKEEDSSLTLEMKGIDYMFFLSAPIGFLSSGAELEVLRNFIFERGGVDTISVLATHADIIGDPKKISEILDKACARLVDSMAEENREVYTYDKIRSCFKAFDCNNLKYCKEFNSDFSKSMKYVVREKFKTLNKELNEQCKKLKKECSDKREGFNETRSSKIDSEDDEQEKFEKGVKNKIKDISKHMDKVIKKCQKKSREKWALAYDEKICEDFILTKIDDKKIKNNKKDKELFASYLSDVLNTRLNKIIEKESKSFSKELESKLEEMAEWSRQYSIDSSIDIDFNGFDFTRAFAAGLTGASVFGALAAWATIVAGGSNLGAYILCAKVVSFLSGLGISLGGTAAVNAAVASIGGPVTIGIALAVLAAGTIFGIFSGTWKKRFAKDLINQYNKHSDDYYDFIDTYWNDTKKALKKCLDSLEEQTTEHHKNLLHTLCLTDIEFEKSKDRMQKLYSQIMGYTDEIIEMLNKNSEESDDDDME